MAISDRDTSYNADGTKRTVYETSDNRSAGWVIGGIIVVALVIIGYFVFAGHSTTPTSVDVNNTPAVTAPVTPAPATPAPSDTTTAPSTNATPMTTTPAAPAPADNTSAPAAAPATPAPAATPAPSATPAAPATNP